MKKFAKLTQFVDLIDKHKIFVLAGSLAFTTSLALAPFIIITLVITGFMGNDIQNNIASEIKSLLGPEASKTINDIIENTQARQDIKNLAGVVSFFILLFSAGAIFSQLRSAFDTINRADECEVSEGIVGFFKDRLISMGLIIGFIFLAVVSLVISSALSVIFASQGPSFLIVAASFLANLLCFAAVFMGIYHFVPSHRIMLRKCLLAGILASAGFGFGKYVIGIYIGNSAVASAYGAAGAMVAFLVWVYYTSLVLLLSYEFVVFILPQPKDR